MPASRGADASTRTPATVFHGAGRGAGLPEPGEPGIAAEEVGGQAVEVAAVAPQRRLGEQGADVRQGGFDPARPHISAREQVQAHRPARLGGVGVGDGQVPLHAEEAGRHQLRPRVVPVRETSPECRPLAATVTVARTSKAPPAARRAETPATRPSQHDRAADAGLLDHLDPGGAGLPDEQVVERRSAEADPGAAVGPGEIPLQHAAPGRREADAADGVIARPLDGLGQAEAVQGPPGLGAEEFAAELLARESAGIDQRNPGAGLRQADGQRAPRQPRAGDRDVERTREGGQLPRRGAHDVRRPTRASWNPG